MSKTDKSNNEKPTAAPADGTKMSAPADGTKASDKKAPATSKAQTIDDEKAEALAHLHDEPALADVVTAPIKAVHIVAETQFMKEFREFLNRGSVIDLAIGVAVGGAFTSIAKSLVDDIIMPLVGLIMGGVNLAEFSLTIPNIFGADESVTIAYGNFLQNVVNFIVVAFAVFLLVKFINKLNRKEDARKKAAADQKS